LRVAAIGYLTGPYMYPIFALMSRELAFGTLAFISVMMALSSATVSISLAILGFSYMSFAWATVISATAGTLLCFYFWRDLSLYRPTLSEWRGVIEFGAYDSATAVCDRIGESVPYLIFGRLLNAEAVGLGQRAVSVCLFPERVILAGVGAVALPGFSKQVHSGGPLKDIYLRATQLITAVQWPALIMLALLAQPIVSVLLGRQWLEVVPLIQILSAALLFSFPLGLQYPTLVAVGAIRYMPPLIIVQSVVMLTAVSFVAPHGLRATALSMLLAIPLNVLLSLLLVRRYVVFRWAEFAAALSNSVLLSVVTAAGPVAIVIGSGWRSDLSVGAAFVAMVLSGFGWIGGLWLSRHPLLHELLRARDSLFKTSIAGKVVAVSKRLLAGWR
jgi:O-antigen/teichoic acid export membrane protein